MVLNVVAYNVCDVVDDDDDTVDDDTKNLISVVCKNDFLTQYADADNYGFDLDPVDFLFVMLTVSPETMGEVCAGDGNYDALANFGPAKKRSVGFERTDCDTYDQPSDTEEPICFDENPGVNVGFLVNGQDQAGGVSAYNDKVFISQVLEFQEQYGHEYIDPVVVYATDGLSVNYYWPKNIPLPILGKSLHVGNVVYVDHYTC